ncbi:MAG: AmmeMemoRadiSam system protein B [Planctomycetes bacterium]|uniref:AmmeMemoRadiSam system protein B n=1 Tax=Candidatus Wunengus sp. YC65 TaxID=3367701 RepID=UPI001DDFB676|nr:AmmeMemoRadiSam system protein B [Planctomycetota bacterium]
MKSLFLPISLFVALLTPSLLFAETETSQVWEPQVAGRFYPGNETVLKEQIDTFLKKIPKQSLKGKPVAIISPHAGYQYSGQVAAYGYSAIKDAGFNRVVILAPSHFMSGKRFRGVSILPVKNFKTPLGVIPVDEDACNQLLNSSKESKPETSLQATKLFGTYEGAYKGEHSLETQLPFLQMALGTFKLVPVIVGVLIDNDYDQVANAIRPLMDDKTLVVVSSDFTHYGEGYGYVPFRKDIEKNVRSLDYGAFDKILSKDFDGLRIYRKETGINACGIIPIALLLKLLPSEAQGEILNYDTSGHQSNDFSFSVSYASVLFTKPLETKSGHYIPKTETPDNNQSFCLTNKEKSLLLSLARSTLEAYTKTGAPPKFDQTEYALPPRLKEKYGVFVTLKKHGELRGCIGYIVPRSPLSHAVIENTINSSANDWRFTPVDAKEVQDITIEISVLSQMKKINGPDEFIVGKEGIVIRKGPASAVFLPQVATEQGWDRAETLCQLCRKAGLSPDAWKDDEMEFFVFTANVFHEGEKT